MKKLGLKVALFIAGFSFVYIALGVSVAFAGSFFRLNMNWLFAVAGVILIVFGLHVMHIFRIPWLERQVGGMDKAKEAENIFGAFLVGVAFAIGWSPCTGPIVAAILGLAAKQQTVFAGGLLLLGYCVGLGVPFLLVGLAVGKFLRMFEKMQKHMRKVEIVSGLLLILLGILFVSQNANFFRDLIGGSLGLSMGEWEHALAPRVGEGVSLLAFGAAVLAGFLSFISPCVLPLLPSYVAFIAGTDDINELYGEGS